MKVYVCKTCFCQLEVGTGSWEGFACFIVSFLSCPFFIRVFFFWCGVFEAQNWMIFFFIWFESQNGKLCREMEALGPHIIQSSKVLSRSGGQGKRRPKTYLPYWSANNMYMSKIQNESQQGTKFQWPCSIAMLNYQRIKYLHVFNEIRGPNREIHREFCLKNPSKKKTLRPSWKTLCNMMVSWDLNHYQWWFDGDS